LINIIQQRVIVLMLCRRILTFVAVIKNDRTLAQAIHVGCIKENNKIYLEILLKLFCVLCYYHCTIWTSVVNRRYSCLKTLRM